jgi:hypothetical protein
VSTPAPAPPAAQARPSPAAAVPVPPVACPGCGTTVAPDQDWCLACGAAARTRLAPAPNWRIPVAVLSALALAAVVALILAFASLTSQDGSSTTSTPTVPGRSAPVQPPGTG